MGRWSWELGFVSRQVVMGCSNTISDHMQYTLESKLIWLPIQPYAKQMEKKLVSPSRKLATNILAIFLF
jgi:hypothetical protein